MPWNKKRLLLHNTSILATISPRNGLGWENLQEARGGMEHLKFFILFVQWWSGEWATGERPWDAAAGSNLWISSTLAYYYYSQLSCSIRVDCSPVNCLRLNLNIKRSSRGHFCGLLYPSCMRRGLINKTLFVHDLWLWLLISIIVLDSWSKESIYMAICCTMWL